MTRSVADHSAGARPSRERAITLASAGAASRYERSSASQRAPRALCLRTNDKKNRPTSDTSLRSRALGGRVARETRAVRCRLAGASRCCREAASGPQLCAPPHGRVGNPCLALRRWMATTKRTGPPESGSARRTAVDSVLGGLSTAWRNCRGKTIYPAGAQ